MKSLRTAVIGAGRIGWMFHIPQALRHEGFDLVAVVDPLQERLDEVRAEFGVEGYLEYDELPACVFPPEVEKTYDRSIAKFVDIFAHKAKGGRI